VFFSSLQHFQTLPHRMQFVGIFGGVRCIDDSLATIPEATCAALAALPQLEGLIVGGYDRGIPFESVGRCIAQHDKLPWVYIFRPSGNLIAQAIVQTWQQRAQSGEIQDLQISGKIAPIEQATEITIAARRNTISLSQTLLFVDSMNDVAIHAFQHLQEGATVLLSPASPSFGQFRNYEEKSAAFIQAFSQAKRRS
jgi:UDP-N-acetylmuramoylalanine--D-glutamate ligase